MKGHADAHAHPASRRTAVLGALLANGVAERGKARMGIFEALSRDVTADHRARIDRVLPAAIQVERESGVDREILLAIATVESSLRPSVVNEIGCVGLMQICPSTAHEFGATGDQLKEPVTNFRAGVFDLRRKGWGAENLLTVFKGFGGFDDEVTNPPVDDPIRYRDEVLGWATKYALMDL